MKRYEEYDETTKRWVWVETWEDLENPNLWHYRHGYKY